MTTTHTPDKATLQARLAELKNRRPTFTAEDGTPMPTIQAAPKTTNFRRSGILAQAQEINLSDDAKQIDQLVTELPMNEAIRLWGKPQSDYKRAGENTVLIRCPKPEHPDKHPSASADLAQGLWHCHACQEGGDKYTLAALHHGYGNDYQAGKNFVDLKKKVATDLGYTITETSGHTVLTPPTGNPPAPAPVIEPVSFDAPEVPQLVQTDDGSWFNPATGELMEPPQQTTPAPAPAPVPMPVSFDDIELDEEPTSRAKPQLDWKPVGKNRSFLDRYMACATKKSYPDAFAFAGALMCLGFVGNRNVRLSNEDPLHSGMGILTIAGTGAGKSRAMRDALNVIERVMPWRGAEFAMLTGGQIVPGSGVKSIPGAGSGENVIKQFEDVVSVPNGTKADGSANYEDKRYPVNGAVSFEELSQLVGKASATGSTLRERIMNFLDGAHLVENSTNTQGTYKAVDPFAFIYTSVQPRMVSKLITENDEHSGFINRFAIFTGDPKPRDPRNMTPIPMDDADEALKELKNHWDGIGEVLITYNPDALEAMAVYVEQNIYANRDQSNGLTGRLDVLFWKLILLICINECTTKVTEDIVGKAVHLHQYFIATYAYVGGELYDPSEDPSEKRDGTEKVIVARIEKVMGQKRDKGAQEPIDYAVTASEVWSGVRRHFSHHSVPSQAFNRTLDGMVDIGLITRTQGPRGSKYLT